MQRTPHSLLWLAAIQIVERNKNLPGLTPKDSFVATEAVESIIRQITQPQETTGELNIRNHLALGLKSVLKSSSSRLRSQHYATWLADPSLH